MRGLILLSVFCLVSPVFGDDDISPNPSGTAAPKIDDYQRENPHDPRAKAPQKPPAATDQNGLASGAKPLPGDVQQAQSPEEQQKYVASVQQALVTWDKRIEELDRKPSTQPAAKILHTLRERTKADLLELGKVKGKAWLDVKARIESRFRRMEKEYEAIKA